MATAHPNPDPDPGQGQPPDTGRADWPPMPVIGGPGGVDTPRPDRQDGAVAPPPASTEARPTCGRPGAPWLMLIGWSGALMGMMTIGGLGSSAEVISVRASVSASGHAVVQVDSDDAEVRVRALPSASAVQVLGDDGTACHADDGSVFIGSLDVTCGGHEAYVVTVPRGADVEVEGGGGRIEVEGTFRDVDARSGSGTVGFTGDTDPNGTGVARLEAGSGDILVRIESHADVRARSGSGDIAIDLAGQPGTVEAQAGSGDVEVHGVRPGAQVRADAGSGDVELSPSLAEGTDAERAVRVQTGSGDIQVLQ